MNIEALKNKLLIKYPFFGAITSNTSFIESKFIDTAATDGENLLYNRSFLESLTEEQQIFVLAHEVCHIAFDHVYRSKGKNQKYWNIATDSVINALLQNDGLDLVKGAINIPEAINYNAEEMYEKLVKEEQEKQQQNQQQNGGNGQSNNSQEDNQQQNGGNGQSNSSQEDNQQQNGENGQSTDSQDNNLQDVGHDSHGLWEDAIKKKEQESKNENNNNNNNIFDRIIDKIKKATKDKEEQEQNQENEQEQKQSNIPSKEELKNMPEQKAFKENQKLKDNIEKEFRKNLVKNSYKQAGNSTNSTIRTVEDTAEVRPAVNWKRLLKTNVRHSLEWSYRDATIEDGIITPHLEDKPYSETEILIDTSGSVNENLLKNFISQCKTILNVSRLKIGCFDTEFYGFQTIKHDSDIDRLEFKGYGGTDFDVAVESFSPRAENKIVFTDGEANMPKKPVNAIWIVYGNEKISPPGGKVIYIKEEDLIELLTTFTPNENRSKSL